MPEKFIRKKNKIIKQKNGSHMKQKKSNMNKKTIHKKSEHILQHGGDKIQEFDVSKTQSFDCKNEEIIILTGVNDEFKKIDNNTFTNSGNVKRIIFKGDSAKHITQISGLPTTLTHLILPGSQIQILNNDVQQDHQAKLSDLTALTHLDLSNSKKLTQITGDALPISLTHLTITKSQITKLNTNGDDGGSNLSKLTKLTHLDLSNSENLTQITNAALPDTLTHLTITKSKITKLNNTGDANIANLSNLSALTHLDLSNSTQLNEITVDALPTTLTHLILPGSKITKLNNTGGANTANLSNLTALTHLDLSNTENLNEITGLPNSLTHLILPGSKITKLNNNNDENTANLSKLSALTHLDLSNTENLNEITDNALPNSLETLKIGSPKFTEIIPAQQFNFTNKENLQELDLSGCTGLTKINGNSFLGCTNLQTFTITDANALTTIEENAFNLDYNINIPLKMVTIQGSQIEKLTTQFQLLPELEVLNLNYSKNLEMIQTNAFLNDKKLISLKLNNCQALKSIQNNAFKGVLEGRNSNNKKLKIHMDSIKNISIGNLNNSAPGSASGSASSSAPGSEILFEITVPKGITTTDLSNQAKSGTKTRGSISINTGKTIENLEGLKNTLDNIKFDQLLNQTNINEKIKEINKQSLLLNFNKNLINYLKTIINNPTQNIEITGNNSNKISVNLFINGNKDKLNELEYSKLINGQLGKDWPTQDQKEEMIKLLQGKKKEPTSGGKKNNEKVMKRKPKKTIPKKKLKKEKPMKKNIPKKK